MNPSQLWALLKLRFQLSKNQITKAGKINTVIATIFYAIGAIAVVSAFFMTSIGGALLFGYTDSFSMIMIWNIVAGLFLFIWLMGLITELQQTEVISVDKLLHLPVSLQGAFFLNYTSTFFNGSFLFFAPALLGACLGMTIAFGWHMAISFPLVISFLFLVTSLTHQLRGWLANLMENKRAKGTIGAMVMVFVIAITQVPNLAIQVFRGDDDKQRELAKVEAAEKRETALAFLDVTNPSQTIGWEVLDIDAQIEKQIDRQRVRDKRDFRAKMVDTLQTVDTFVPPAWMPLGIFRAYKGSWVPGLLGALGMFAIGFVSLAMSYYASMRKYTGAARKKAKRKSKAKAPPKLDFLFKQIPFCKDSVSAVALSCFRSLIRSPETKMMLILPIIFAMLGCGYLFSGSDAKLPKDVWPAIPIAAIALTMFSVASSIANQFGIDRDGFRAYVLSPLDRRDILVGKNLAFIPLCFGIAFMLLIVIQFIFPSNLLAFIANMLQIPCNFLLYCLVGNTASIFFPMGIKRGTMQPSNPRFLPMLILVLATFVLPTFMLTPTCIAVGLPLMLGTTYGGSFWWLYLLLTVIQLIATVALYLYVVRFQGFWLWSREPKILDVVANVPE